MGVKLALSNDPRRAPRWLNVILLAERWGVPPWEIWEKPGARRWIARQAVVDEARKWKREYDGG